MLQGVVLCCSVNQCVAVFFQCVAGCCSVLQCVAAKMIAMQDKLLDLGLVNQCVAVCCRVL